jgi:hypothetical protein
MSCSEPVGVEYFPGRGAPSNAAFAMKQDATTGSLEVGKRADLVMLDRDIFRHILSRSLYHCRYVGDGDLSGWTACLYRFLEIAHRSSCPVCLYWHLADIDTDARHARS